MFSDLYSQLSATISRFLQSFYFFFSRSGPSVLIRAFSWVLQVTTLLFWTSMPLGGLVCVQNTRSPERMWDGNERSQKAGKTQGCLPTWKIAKVIGCCTPSSQCLKKNGDLHWVILVGDWGPQRTITDRGPPFRDPWPIICFCTLTGNWSTQRCPILAYGFM